MNDPWADLKGRYMQPLYPVPWLQAIRDVERMTTDADALLTVMRAAQSLDMLLGALGAHASLAESGPDADLLHDALAALPEHLRGDTNERSRKA